MSITRRPFRLLLCLALGLVLQLHAATAKDIQGEWQVDGPATWEAMKQAPQIAAMPPEQQKAMEAMMVGQLGEMSSVVTADTITQTMPDGKTKKRTYKVTKIEGDTVTTEDTDETGKTDTTHILVKGDTLALSNPQHPGMTIILKRKAAK